MQSTLSIRTKLCVLLIFAQISIFNLPSQTFSATSSMPAARFLHTATLLQDGTVLIVGGVNMSSALIYNPTTGAFKPASGSLTGARFNHTATLLPNGMVLIAGGDSDNSSGFDSGPVSTAELYNPATGQFSTTTELMTTVRDGATATLLNNGKVLIAGGVIGTGTKTAEIYDPATGAFTATGSMHTARYFHTATLLSDGSVLVTGGLGQNGGLVVSNTAEIYFPSSGQFTPVGNMAVARFSHTATLMNNGNVLIAGGGSGSSGNGTVVSSAEIYNPASLSFATTGTLKTARFQHTATPLKDGTVLITGGATTATSSAFTNSAEIYSLSNGTFTTTGDMTSERTSHTSTLLNDGRVLLTGGIDSSSPATLGLATAELYSYPLTMGAMTPKFIVLGILYSPPGAKSAVNYSKSVAQGTNSSFKDAFTLSTSLSASLGITQPSIGGTLTGTTTTEWSQQADSTSSYTVTKTDTNAQQVQGPLSSTIGIDHDYDEILVWVNPKVNLSVGAIPTNILWNGYSFDSNDAQSPNDLDIVPVSIFCLKNPSWGDCITTNQRLARSWDTTSGLGGLTLDDFAQIAARDPFFVNPSYNPNNDPNNRFTSIGQAVEYVPAPVGDGAITTSGSLTTQITSTAGQDASDSYGVSFTLDESIKAIISEDLKSTTSTTWTNQWSASQTETVGQTSQYSVTSPLSTDNYSGPTEFEVWQDNVYGTFMFVAPGTTPTSPGSIGVNPSSLSFNPTSPGGTSSPTLVTLTNNSAIPIFMGDPSAFPFTSTTTAQSPAAAFSDPSFSVVSGSDACSGKIIAPGATCTLSVQFSPVASEIGSSGSTTLSGKMYVAGATDAAVLATIPVGGIGSIETLSLSTSGTPSTFGSPVTFTSTISNAQDNCTFRFAVDGTFVGNGSTSGSTATFTTSTLTAGSHTINATCTANNNFAPVAAPALTQVVNQATPTLSLSTSGTPSIFGNPVTFTSTISNAQDSCTFRFSVDGTFVGNGTTNGSTATFTTSTLTAGSHTINATCTANNNFAPVGAPALTQVVNQASPTLSLSTSGTPSALGSPVTFTSTISNAQDNCTFRFAVDGTFVGNGTTSGSTATFTTSTLTAGSHTINATCTGNNNFVPVGAPALTQVVN
jgi:large repetitive protein